MKLDEIALAHGTDKASSHHGYAELYERYLPRTDEGTLLELGWGGHEDPEAGGASARMWLDWLPDWRVVVVDNEEKTAERALFDAGLVLLAPMDQASPKILAHGPFDVIIDDASHLSSKTIESFRLLWPHLKPGGWYVVEDTHMAYHDHYYGEDEASADPDEGRAPSDLYANGPTTAMGFLKRLADEANFNPGHHPEDRWDLFPPEYWLGYDVAEIHFHFNICFVRKR